MQKIITSALAVFSLAAIATPASAEYQTVEVRFADLDLTNDAGIAALHGRINAAIKQICGRPEVRDVRDGADHRRCVREAQASATVELARLGRTGKSLAINIRR